MNDQDFAYLQATLAVAQQNGDKSVVVSVSELQSLIGSVRIARTINKRIPQVLGFIAPADLKQMRMGTLDYAKIKRTATDHRNTRVFTIRDEHIEDAYDHIRDRALKSGDYAKGNLVDILS